MENRGINKLKKYLILIIFFFAGSFFSTANATFIYNASGQRHMQYLGNNTWEIWCTEPWTMHCFTIVIDDNGYGWLYFSAGGQGINIGNDYEMIENEDGGNNLIYKDHGNQ